MVKEPNLLIANISHMELTTVIALIIVWNFSAHQVDQHLLESVILLLPIGHPHPYHAMENMDAAMENIVMNQ